MYKIVANQNQHFIETVKHPDQIEFTAGKQAMVNFRKILIHTY